ncbi:MAG: FkbM family methyltransferase [Pirellulales bacterium]
MSSARLEQLGQLANDELAGFLVARLCRPGMMFVDVGAHIGSVVAEVLHHCPNSPIVAVEAVPAKVENLRRRFPSVDIISCALGEVDGETSFSVDTVQSGYSTLAERNGSGAEKITVRLHRLDSVICGSVDVLKIDVEGAELGVLRGGEQLIAKCRPVIMFESGPEEPLHTHADLWQWFADRSYDVLVPNRLAHHSAGLSLDSFLDSHVYPRRATNYFAVPVERREEIREKAYKLLH